MMTMREMTIRDYDQMCALWSSIEGLAISEADSRASIESYLLRNQGLSFVCEENGRIVGTVLAGHDGRRGFIYHLAVDPDYRKQKIGRRLAELSLNRLREEGIDKCHIFVIEDNEAGNSFWSAEGWEKRSGFFVYSRNTAS